jgi:hypothetical protein
MHWVPAFRVHCALSAGVGKGCVRHCWAYHPCTHTPTGREHH